MLKRIFGKKLNNKGLSLVELICALGILSLVGIGLAGFLTVSTRSFVRNSSEVEVQQEAQFATRIINNLVMSATEAPTPITGGYEIKIGADVYQIIHDPGTKLITLSYAGNVEILAENVETFSLDLSQYSSKKSAEVSIKFEKGAKQYDDKVAVKSRNGDTNLVSGDGSANIIIPTEIVLEPNQEYEIPVSVVGISNQNVLMEVFGASDASNTVIVPGTKKIRISKNETSSELTVHVKTSAFKSGTTEPAAEATVRVYVRRVTGITVTGTRKSGNNLKAGAVYRISAALAGNHLDKKPTLASDSDYKEAKLVSFAYSYANESGVVDYNSHVQIVGEHQYEGVNTAYVDIKLLTDIDTNDAFTIMIKSLHPEGNDGAGRTYNKSGLPYVGDHSLGFDKNHILGSYTISNGYFTYISGSIKRGSDDAQAGISRLISLRSTYEATHGTCHPTTEWRFRKILSEDEATGRRTYGPWTTWLPNPMKADSEGSTVVNLRPEATAIFEPNSKYEIQIKLCIKDDAGEIVWPEADTPSYEYLIEDSIEPVHLFFKFGSSFNFFDREVSSDPGRGDVPLEDNTEYKMTWASTDPAIGIKYDKVMNAISFRIQRLEGTDWVDVKSIKTTNLTIKTSYGHPNGQSDIWTIDQKGRYRVLVEGQNVELGKFVTTPVDIGGKLSHYVSDVRNVQFWNLDLNIGVFYFNAQ